MTKQIKKLSEGLYSATLKPGVEVSFSGFSDPAGMDAIEVHNEPKPITKNKIKWASWGPNNDLPKTIMSLVYNNNQMPGALETKDNIAIGDKIIFYYDRYEDGKIIPTPFEDIQLSDWLESVGAMSYVEEAVIDFHWFANFFTLLETGRGSKSDKVVRIKALEAIDCRVSVMDPKQKRPLLCGVGDWKKSDIDPEVIQLYNPEGNKGRFVYHSKKRSPGAPYYPLPGWIGAQYWIRHANKIPLWKSSNMDNSISPKYHIEYPERYFLNKYPDPQFSRAQREKKIEEKIQEIAEALTGVENVSKSFVTQFSVDSQTGKELPGWKITPIKNEINHEAYSKDFLDSLSAIGSAVSVDPALSGVMEPGKMGAGSGSEIREAFEFHSKVKTRYVRHLLYKPLLIAMKSNGLDVRKVDGQDRKIQVGIQDIELTTLEKNPTGSQKTL